MKPVFFKTQADLRRWFEKNHDKKSELIVGYYKTGSGKAGISWSQSVDQALCFGWIDGIRKSINDESYCNRFTPRRPKSNWSAVNIKKIEELTASGLMHPAGLSAFMKREGSRSRVYSYENIPARFPQNFEKEFKTNKNAWEFFRSQPPYYQKTAIHWVMSAKQETTKQARFEKLIKASGALQRV